MSILIKGMEMPKNGKYILCSIRSDGKVITDLITGGCEEYEAIELPPHGDLIDRTELNDKIYHTSFCDPVVDWHDICHAPAIIESEREQ